MSIHQLKSHFPWITLLVLVALVGINDPNFLKPVNLLSLAGDIVPLFIMALGLTFAIYIGGIDLSAQSMANMITVVASVYLASLGFAWLRGLRSARCPAMSPQSCWCPRSYRRLPLVVSASPWRNGFPETGR
jgi:ribose/xylose/arabinose/galactoside ABC-type transport system permease subunit